MKRTLALFGIALLSATAVVAVASSGKPAAAPAGVTPVPIPPGYGFPTAKATIDGWVATSNTTAIRNHAWEIWAGMGSPSGQGKLPVFETWLSTNDLLPAIGLTASHRNKDHQFVRPRQFNHEAQLRHLLIAPGPTPAASPAVINRFDPAAATFITAPQAGPGGKTYHYNSKASLTALNNAWPTGTTPEKRGINNFPDEGIETKQVYSLVKAKGLTPLPLWQGQAATVNPASPNPTPNTWLNCVLVDPAGSGAVQPATSAQIASVAKNLLKGLSCKTFLYAPLSTLYSFAMDAAEAKAFNSAQGSSNAAAGDYAVLVGMHVNSREIDHWTWQTFYWQPVPDQPNQMPGNKTGQPTNLAAPFTNYAMCANYDQTTTPGGKVMDVCFNPYLETSPGIPAGITSNCMSCHGVAGVGAIAGYPASYTKPIAFFTDPKYFTNKVTHTDFSWQIPAFP